MAAATLRDKVAVKVKAMPSVDHVYANGSTDATIAPIPAEFTEQGVSAVVYRGPTTHSGGTGNQDIDRVFEVVFLFSVADRGAAENWVDKLDDELIAEFSSGITLGGSARRGIWFAGSEAPEQDDDDHWSWLARITVGETVTTEVTA